jgi:signal transduction histidine kinase
MERPRPPLIGRLTRTQLVVLDCVTAGLAVVLTAYLSRPSVGIGPGIPDAVVAAVAVLAAGFRRSAPVPSLALVVVVGLLTTGIASFPTPWVAVAFVIYVIPLRFPRTESVWLFAGTITAGVVAILGAFAGPGPNRVTMVIEMALLVTVAWTMGYAVRHQRLYTAGEREREQRQAADRVAEARRALNEERLQIARELHDVVAHTLSVIAVQAGVANHVATEHPDEASRALSSIEETSRGALQEMRSMLGFLREDGTPRSPSALPGLTDLDGLVARGAAAGIRVNLVIDGERPALSPGLDRAAYRVIQEAVTNVIKHAATTNCRVGVTYGSDAVSIEVVDDGVGTDTGLASAGHGIIGMRERVIMYGGEFTAEARPAGGFRVNARFPLSRTVMQ